MRSRRYRVLLLLLPPSFRRACGAELERLFMERRRDVASWRQLVALWAMAVWDVVSASAREWSRLAREAAGDFTGEGWGMDGWLQDVRFAVRALARRPGFTLAAAGTLALGIGINVSIFSVVNGVLLTPLPYPAPDDLMVVWTVNREDRGRGIDHPDVRAVQASVPGISVAGYSGTRPTLTGFGDPEVLYGARVSDGLITLMGLEPHLGRDLLAADDIADGPRVVVVSHQLWSSRLGRDPDVLGRSIDLGGEPWEVVGVAPEGFDFPAGAELWMPRRHEVDGCGHGCRIMLAVARLDPASTRVEAQARLDAFSSALAEEHPDAHRDDILELQPMLEYEVADVRAALWVLLGAVGMVLLIACANVANLMLVRAHGRRSEVALRATLGASRMRILRQLLTESLLIAVAAGAAGVAFAHWGTAAFLAFAPSSLPRLDGARMDGTVLVFALILVFAAVVLVGLVPALKASGRSLGASLGEKRGAVGHGASRDTRGWLLVAEVALSVSLLLGTGLLLRSLAEVRRVDLGFDTDRVERFRISLPDSRYDSLQTVAFLESLEVELAAIPGVAAAGFGFGVPLASGGLTTSMSLLDRPPVPAADKPSVEIRPSGVGLLEATGTELVRGRWFDHSDRYGAPGVAVINEAAARLHYPGRDPIGERLEVDISWGFATTPPVTIVGVVRDVVRQGPTLPPAPAVYLANAQFAAGSGYAFMRLAPGTATAIPQARAVLARLDPGLALWNTVRMEDVVEEARAPNLFYASLLSVFSGLALLLAAVGLYGVVAYAVSQRTREIGIRIALGAAGEEVVGMVVREGARPALVGLAVGLVASLFGARVLDSMLYGVAPQDPLTVAAVTVVLLMVVALATVVPARRASRIPPADALRTE